MLNILIHLLKIFSASVIDEEPDNEQVLERFFDSDDSDDGHLTALNELQNTVGILQGHLLRMRPLFQNPHTSEPDCCPHSAVDGFDEDSSTREENSIVTDRESRCLDPHRLEEVESSSSEILSNSSDEDSQSADSDDSSSETKDSFVQLRASVARLDGVLTRMQQIFNSD